MELETSIPRGYSVCATSARSVCAKVECFSIITGLLAKEKSATANVRYTCYTADKRMQLICSIISQGFRRLFSLTSLVWINRRRRDLEK